MADDSDIVELISRGTRGGYDDYLSIDTPSMAENAARGDQIDSQLMAILTEGSEAEQMQERMAKCAEAGGEYDFDTGKCVTSTLGADASISGAKAIKDYLNQMADDKAFGELAKNIGTATAQSPTNTALGLLGPTGETIATCDRKGMDYQASTGMCVARKALPDNVVTKAGGVVEKVLSTVMGGVDDTVVGDVINKGAEGLGKVIGGAIGKVMPGWDTDVIIGTDGSVDWTIIPPNTPTPNTGDQGVTVSSTQNSSGGDTTVTIDTGSGVGNLVLGGGSVKDVVDVLTGQEGEGGYTQAD